MTANITLTEDQVALVRATILANMPVNVPTRLSTTTNKIQVIKMFRDNTILGLFEAKTLADIMSILEGAVKNQDAAIGRDHPSTPAWAKDPDPKPLDNRTVIQAVAAFRAVIESR